MSSQRMMNKKIWIGGLFISGGENYKQGRFCQNQNQIYSVGFHIQGSCLGMLVNNNKHSK